jgi:hypothetical protein
MKRLLLGWATLLALLTFTLSRPVDAGDKKDDKGWVQLFNSKDLTGWKSHPKSPGKWKVEDNAIVSGGLQVSHLFSDRGDYENFHYRIEARINDKGNSGQYFRARFAPGYPPGYEAQINSTSTDAVRTGSLYPSFKLTPADREKILVKEMLVPADTWFTQEVVADGNHIIIKVNGKTTVDFVDKNNTYTRGHFALQQHGAIKIDGKEYETVLRVRKVEVKELPATKKADN